MKLCSKELLKIDGPFVKNNSFLSVLPISMHATFSEEGATCL